MLGQFLCAVEEEDDEDGLGEGLEVAAWAIAAPPATRTPVRVRAARVFRTRNRIVDHLLPCGTYGSSEEDGP
jgi:hypothetical protein